MGDPDKSVPPRIPTPLERCVDTSAWVALTLYASIQLGLNFDADTSFSSIIMTILKVVGIGIGLQFAYVIVGVILAMTIWRQTPHQK